MKLRIERDGITLYDGEVDTFEYAEKTDGTVSCVGTPAKPERGASGIAEIIKQAGQKLADDRRAKTEETVTRLRAVQQTSDDVSSPDESVIDLGEPESVEQTD